MSVSGLETLPDVPEGWEAFPNVRQLSGGPRGYSGVARRPFQMSGSGLDALMDVQQF